MNHELYEQGQQLRRRILGDAYVDAAAVLDSFRVAEQVFAERQS